MTELELNELIEKSADAHCEVNKDVDDTVARNPLRNHINARRCRVKWLRARFKTNAEDYRPIYDGAHPEGPWWCTGYDSDDNAIIVAYVMSPFSINKQWPEATETEINAVEKPTFSSRFPKPEWWTK